MTHEKTKRSEVKEMTGKTYVILRNASGTLAVYLLKTLD
jgi:hypothetical protein